MKNHGFRACAKPESIKVRRASDKVEVNEGGPQVYQYFDTVVGFRCANSEQDNDEKCEDYEIQLCCPREFRPKCKDLLKKTVKYSISLLISFSKENLYYNPSWLKSKLSCLLLKNSKMVIKFALWQELFGLSLSILSFEYLSLKLDQKSIQPSSWNAPKRTGIWITTTNVTYPVWLQPVPKMGTMNFTINYFKVLAKPPFFRTWISNVTSDLFCVGGAEDCTHPLLPNCEDRTIKCLDPLPLPEDMDQENKSSKDVFDSQSYGAKFTYKCKEPGKLPFKFTKLQCVIGWYTATFGSLFVNNQLWLYFF